MQQLILQTERLEVTRQVFVLDHDKALERELLLLKVEADVHNRAELREVGSIYKAKIIDLSPDSMVFELIGKPEKIDAFLKMFDRYLAVPAYKCEGGGEVVVEITVNRAGDVTNARVVEGGDECMRSSALGSARRSRFNIDDSAPARQQGTITYIFIPQ